MQGYHDHGYGHDDNDEGDEDEENRDEEDEEDKDEEKEEEELLKSGEREQQAQVHPPLYPSLLLTETRQVTATSPPVFSHHHHHHHHHHHLLLLLSVYTMEWGFPPLPYSRGVPGVLSGPTGSLPYTVV
jgi:hypothetical protein